MAKIPHPSLDRFVAEPAELVEALAASGDRAALRADLTVRLREVLEEGWQVAREMLSRPRSGMAAAQQLSAVMDAVLISLHHAATQHHYRADIYQN